MTHLYVLTDPDKFISSSYKIGIHTGDIISLRKRYITSLPNVRILFFREMSNSRVLETKIKKKFFEKRQTNCNGHTSEWFVCELFDILSYITDNSTNDFQVESLQLSITNLQDKLDTIRTITNDGKQTPLPVIQPPIVSNYTRMRNMLKYLHIV